MSSSRSQPCAEAQEPSHEPQHADGRERPILFSGPMVRAVLDDWKTQTRRSIKGAPVHALAFVGANDLPTGEFGLCLRYDRVIDKHVRCPYGVPGDRLWVREAWAFHERFSDVARIVYAASERRSWSEAHEDFPVELAGPMQARAYQEGWRPSIHMPRWASRITLEVTEVRVERLLDISSADALAEGIQRYSDGFHWEATRGWPGEPPGSESVRFVGRTAAQAYRGLWEEINGRKSLDANPWVWVVGFRRKGVAPLSVAAGTADDAPGRPQ